MDNKDNSQNKPSMEEIQKMVDMMNFMVEIDWRVTQEQKKGLTREEAINKVFQGQLPPLP